MNLFVLLKMVPDTVEELNVAGDGRTLDAEFLRCKISEPDEHALEQALLLKERCGGKVTVVALDAPELDDALYTALARGADRAVKLAVEPPAAGTVAAAEIFAGFLKSDVMPITPDTLILPGSQAYDDLQGELAPYLAGALGLPYVGVVCAVMPGDGRVTVLKEFSGGLRGEFEVTLPAVLGIQSAEKPPRYVPIAKVRAVQKSAKIETVTIAAPTASTGVTVDRMFKPEATDHAQMIEGSSEEIVEKLAGVLAERGVLPSRA